MLDQNHKAMSTKRGIRPIPAVVYFVGIAFIAIFSYFAFAFRSDKSHMIKLPNHTNHSAEYNEPKQKFKIRQIFHNSADGETHKKLDINEKFLDQYAVHLLENTNDIEDLDLFANNQSPFEYEFELKSQASEIMRLETRHPDFVESYLNYALEVGSAAVSRISLDWTTDKVSIPDVNDPVTILNLALMSADAYVNLPTDAEWEDVGTTFNQSDKFGWLGRGVRGHVFTDTSESTVIIAIKGTSAAGLNSGDDATVDQDKINDNLLFSCCCARISSFWTTVCDCYESSYTCNQNCLERELRRQDRYYKAVLDIYRNVTYMYPNAEIWVTGHSLGGALSALLARTFGLPAVAYEAPGDLLATRRLHLPMPPGFPSEMEHIWHIGNTADPIYMGVCTGASSTCAIAGYAMETQCHTGKKCVYDTVTDLGWHVNMLNHRLRKVIDNVLRVYNETAPCNKAPPCYDCYNWKFVDHTKDRYRKTATTLSTATATPTEPSDGNCLKRTWYGRCYEWDNGSSSSTSSSSSTDTTLTTKTRSSSTSLSTTSTSSTSTENPDTPKCIRWSWFGYCQEYEHKPESSSMSSAIQTSSNYEVTESLSSSPSALPSVATV
ncbi:hypothetical protein CANARDRAFT_27548 [[Candida] arabinofermentans NRRL YB-2248]|uniref:Putative lipase ATG15 n=1 Tax=[Candida] arabinofermentans NRRL YB-2248 TaxID=983967 RepID=A0A1E4T3H9_9ASCO|nr:hypothetical protein CANARDRAFT_27548 [[Candida] arabinofermentans NRRL YB-2248]